MQNIKRGNQKFMHRKMKMSKAEQLGGSDSSFT